MTSERRLAYQREWYHKNKKTTEAKRTEFDQFSYRVVPHVYRNMVATKSKTYETPEITSPIVLDVLRGKTVLVDYTLPHGDFNSHPFRTLYSYFNTRGYRLRVHVVDVPDREEFRKLLLWAEPIVPVKYKAA